jgi:hypothetical protein
MRTKLGFIPVGIVVALALLASGARATGGGRSASACSNETVNGGKYVGKLTLRFVLLGNVSCKEAHRLIRAYYRRVKTGPCEGNQCIVKFAGGWTCSFFNASESKETGGTIAGCIRSATGVRIRVYKELGSKSPGPAANTAKASASCGTENTEGGPAHIVASGVSCTRARQVIHDFATKGVFWHFVGTDHENGYSPVDGWRCTLFMGESGCKRGHSVIRGVPLAH